MTRAGLNLTEQDYFDVWNGLTSAQKVALAVLADGREHYCWKRGTDAEAHVGRGCVNATAVGRLTKLKLARHTDYGGPFTGGRVVITDIGQAVWDASTFDATVVSREDVSSIVRAPETGVRGPYSATGSREDRGLQGGPGTGRDGLRNGPAGSSIGEGS